MIRAALSMFSGSFMKWAVYGLILSIAYSVGNLHATQRAKEEQAQLLLAESAKRQAENHLQLVAWTNQVRETLKAEMARQKAADKAAYAVLEQGKAEAEQAAQRARASLRVALAEKQKLEIQTDGLRNVTELLAAEARAPDPPCALDGRVRLAIDTYIASINASIAGSPEAPTARIPYRQDQAPPVSCDQLARSLIDILQHDAELVARDQAWASWADTALR